MKNQNWDYLHIVCEEGRPRYINGQEIPNWQQGPTIFEATHHLFQKGWELVDVPLSPAADWRAYELLALLADQGEIPHHFRRPKN